MMESEAGAMIAPPRPCSARAPTSMPWLAARPPMSEAKPKSVSPEMNTRRCPRRSAARPPSMRKPAKVMV